MKITLMAGSVNEITNDELRILRFIRSEYLTSWLSIVKACRQDSCEPECELEARAP
jgi:hypothetical protein